MKRMFAVLALSMILAGCQLSHDPPPGWRYAGFPHAETFVSPDHILVWVSSNISYRDSALWQTPEETYNLRAGDCADYVLLAMYFFHEQGIDTNMIAIKTTEGYHALMENMSDGTIWDVQTLGSVTIADPGIIVKRYSYQTAMYYAVEARNW